MKVLIIKMSSMGDIVHTFPALTDAGKAINNIRFDWVVEQSFKELPPWHPLVDKIIPVAFRQWKKKPFAALRSGELFQVLKQIRQENYDFIIDAQGLLKSMIMSSFAKGIRCGFNKTSARESWATFIYQKKILVAPDLHVINKIRELFAKSLNYNFTPSVPDYGLRSSITIAPAAQHQSTDYLLFSPNTTWASKHWPEIYWEQLIKLATAENYQIKIPWGAPHEQERAKRLAMNNELVTVLPRMSITEVVNTMAKARAMVGLDTGLIHIAAAHNIPSVSLYGPSDPSLAGALGLKQILLRANFECAPCLKRQCHYPGDKTIDPPCFVSIPPEKVWQELKKLL